MQSIAAAHLLFLVWACCCLSRRISFRLLLFFRLQSNTRHYSWRAVASKASTDSRKSVCMARLNSLCLYMSFGFSHLYCVSEAYAVHVFGCFLLSLPCALDPSWRMKPLWMVCPDPLRRPWAPRSIRQRTCCAAQHLHCKTALVV